MDIEKELDQILEKASIEQINLSSWAGRKYIIDLVIEILTEKLNSK